MDFKKNIPEIEKKIHYTFKDKSLLTQAFTRSSFCNEHRGVGRVEYISNEVLEFFGDSVLSTSIISMMLKEKTERYEHGIYTRLDEGDFSNIRSKLSDKRNLSRSMATLGLQKYLRMGDGDEKLGIENEPSVMEDLFESIIGAVYIDCGMDMARVIKVVSGMLDVSVYFESDAAPIQSFKNALQEWCADKRHRLPAPIYKTISVSGPDHKRVYERAVFIGDRQVALGKGKNQKLADTAAAEAALEILKSESVPEVKVDIESLAALKNYAAKNKQPSPEFRDLGETPESNERSREYIIECRCMGKSASAVGKSKQEARALAAKKVLSELHSGDKPAQKKLRKTSKPAPKKPVIKKQTHNNARKADKSSSPKKQGYQHKKHL
ncbi:MAG: hypothetical protein IJX97_07120 [Clostridia bacterium]|nr:hypothetical protein [Clostridia bacterium]